ncbi:MAG: lactonase family protein [Aureliella sp.]
MTSASLVSTSVQAEVIDVWLGTSSHPASQGIYHCTLDTQQGKLTKSELAAEIRGPGFLAMHPSGSILYAVGALDGVPCVAAYKISGTGKTAKLTLDSSQPIGDGGAAHVSVAPGAKSLLTAQYGAGSTAVFEIDKSGSVLSRRQLMKHTGGSGVVERRQDSPHAHWTGFSPDGRFAFVPDLGLDKVVIYKYDQETGMLAEHGFAQSPPGGGPRHMKFHTSGKWVYVLNELDLSVSVYDYDAQAGKMERKQTIETVSKSELAKEQFKSCSEIRVHPNGQFVYAANRGHDTITAFKVDPQSGKLSVVEVENARAVTPRNFNLTPRAHWALVGGQDSHTLSCFRVDKETGELQYNRSVISTPAPICVLMQAEDSLVSP